MSDSVVRRPAAQKTLAAKQIVKFAPWMTTSSALLELARWYADRNPSEARKYLQRVVDDGDNSSGAVDEATEMFRTVLKQ